MTLRSILHDACDDPRCLELLVRSGDDEPAEAASPREIVRHMLEVVEPMPNRRARAASVRRHRQDLAARHRRWYIDHEPTPADRLRQTTLDFTDTMQRLFGDRSFDD